MIITNYYEFLNKMVIMTDQVSKLHQEAFAEYRKLQEKKNSKFKLRKIFHDGGRHIYVYRWNDYFATEENDCWTLYQQSKLDQLCLELK